MAKSTVKRDLNDVIRDGQDKLRGYPETRMDRLRYWWSTVRLDDILFWIWNAIVTVYVASVVGTLAYIVTTAHG